MRTAKVHLCYSKSENYSSQPSSMGNFNILASLCSCAAWYGPFLGQIFLPGGQIINQQQQQNQT